MQSSFNERAAGVLLAGAVLGAAAETVRAFVPHRADFALIAVVVIAALAILARRGVVVLPRHAARYAAVAGSFVALLLWRDSPVLFALDVGVLLVLVTLMHPIVREVPLHLAGLWRGLMAATVTGFGAWVGSVFALNEVNWSGLGGGLRGRRAWGALIGVATAVPAVLVFGSLFASADPIFRDIAENVIRIDLGPLVEHSVLTVIWAWAFAGVLRIVGAPDRVTPMTERQGSAGFITVATALGVLDLLFLLFVVVQLRYLFGGAELLAAVGLSYSEYAREGFFQLVWVIALALPMLLLMDWSLDARDAQERRQFRWLAGLMLALLVVILISALARMRLYSAEFGLTELRLYTTAFMGWLALVLAWFAATVLRGHRTRFAFGALAAGGAVLVGLNVINPDAIIVRANAARRGAQPFDWSYAATLSGDVVPALLYVSRTLPLADRCEVNRRLRDRFAPAPGRRATNGTWNLSRLRAVGALDDVDPATCAAVAKAGLEVGPS